MMLGQINPNQKKTIVIGAGISGMLACYHLQKYGYEVEIFEQHERVGGLISTLKVTGDAGKDFGLSESAAHSVMATKPVLAFFEEIGVEWNVINRAARSRYVLLQDQMKKVPFEILSFFEFAVILFRISFKPYLGNLCKPNRQLNMQEWGEYFLGKKAVRVLLAPFVSGLYGVTPRSLSVRAAFEGLVPLFGFSILASTLLRRYFKSSKTGRAAMVVPKFGMQDVIDKLLKRICAGNTDTLKTRHIDSIDFSAARKEGKNIFICTPATEALKLLGRSDCRVSYTALTSVTVFVKKSSLQLVPEGVGVLIAPDSSNSVKCMGCLFNSSSFEGRVFSDDMISLTLMYSGELETTVARHATQTTVARHATQTTVARDLSVLFGYKKTGDHDLIVKTHHFEQALPVYDADLEKTWKMLRGLLPTGVVLFGNYTGQISIRGMIETLRRDLVYCQSS